MAYYQQRSPQYRTIPYRQKSPKKRGGRGRLFLVIIVLGVVGFFLFGKDSNLPLVTSEPKPEKVRIEGRYLFNGTVVWARYMQEWSQKSDGTTDYAYPFSGLNTFDRSKYDAWVADLECPVMEEEISIVRQGTETAFNCRPEFLPEAAKYFDIFNLSNNHTRDFNGQAALDETREHLEKNGFQYFGDFEPGKLSNICEVVAMPVRVISKVKDKETSEDAKLPVALCSWHYFFRLPSDSEIEQMRQYAKVMPTFAVVQAGVEYRASADQYQRMIAHDIADLNPSFVLVNSAHWVQNGEVYNNIPILYSTGNFLFDQQYNTEVTRSASLDTKMSIPYSTDMQKWLDLGTSCKEFHDDCFDQIVNKGLKKPEMTMTYDLIAGDNSNKLTKRAGAEVQAADRKSTRLN